MTTDACPKRLYKYLSPERVDVLENATLRYSPFGAFNDPFEGRPYVSALASDQQILDRLDSALPDELKKGYEALPAQVRANISFEAYRKKANDLFQSKKSELLKNLQDHTPAFMEHFYQKANDLIGVLCLAEEPTINLMWAHYAASSSGFVIEFDAHHEYFNSRLSEKDEFRYLRQVRYQEQRPSLPLSEMDAIQWMLVKSNDWAYEKEWRIFRPLADAQKTHPATPYPVNLFGFPREAVTGVILGAQISLKTEASIRETLKAHSEYSTVQLQRVRIDPVRYALHIDSVSQGQLDQDT